MAAALHRFVNEVAHRALREIPALPCEPRVDGGQPAVCAGEGKRRVAGGDESVPPVRDAHRLDIAIAAHDVTHRGRDDGAARGEIFGCLRGTDEACRLVDGEGHQGDVPAA